MLQRRVSGKPQGCGCLSSLQLDLELTQNQQRLCTKKESSGSARSTHRRSRSASVSDGRREPSELVGTLRQVRRPLAYSLPICSFAVPMADSRQTPEEPEVAREPDGGLLSALQFVLLLVRNLAFPLDFSFIHGNGNRCLLHDQGRKSLKSAGSVTSLPLIWNLFFFLKK